MGKIVCRLSVILLTASLLVFPSTVALAVHALVALPGTPGVRAYRQPLHLHLEAIVPSLWKTKLEEEEIEPAPVKPVRFWDQNRSGGLFVALLVTIILMWTVLHYMHGSPSRRNALIGRNSGETCCLR